MCDQCGCGDDNAEKTFRQKVEEMIEVVKPMLQGHGGNIELVSIDDDNTVNVRLQGACSGCPGAQMTLKQGVEKLMKEKIPELKEVVAVD
ncbi:MAG: NifU family protein [Planctomycetes bacterium]|nr:NifU family protein [Planctomycetota bacterium]